MSDTPIFDQLTYEEAWRDEYFGFRQRIVVPAPESTVSVDILPDTTNFLAGMRVGGRRSGRSAAWDEFLSGMQAYTDQVARAMAFPSLSAWVERSDVYPKYSAEVQELARTTGWSLEESADMYERVAKWAADAITEENIKALNRSRMSRQNHYPTSSPSWARKRPR